MREKSKEYAAAEVQLVTLSSSSSICWLKGIDRWIVKGGDHAFQIMQDMSCQLGAAWSWWGWWVLERLNHNTMMMMMMIVTIKLVILMLIDHHYDGLDVDHNDAWQWWWWWAATPFQSCNTWLAADKEKEKWGRHNTSIFKPAQRKSSTYSCFRIWCKQAKWNLGH